MPEPPNLLDWATKYEKQGCGRGVVYAVATRCGTPPAVARELVGDARQEGVTRVLRAYGDRPNRFRDFAHFARTVTRAAVNWVRDQRRRRGPAAVFDDNYPAPTPDPRPAVVVAALGQLTAADRKLVTRAVIDGHSLDKLAARFLPAAGGSANARRLRVRRMLRGALDRLRAKYDEIDIE